jgi:endonuclease III
MKGKLELHPKRAGKVGSTLLEEVKKKGIFGHRELPDDMVKSIADEVDTETLLLIVTLTTSLDYMRNANELWESSLKTYRDDETKWLFDPHKVAEKGDDELLKALSKHGLAKKKKRDLLIWKTISKTLSEKYSGSVKKLFEEYEFKVNRMFTDFLKNRKGEFPSLSGTKLFPHWIRSLKEKVVLPFKCVENLPIPVDVHVARATFTTGCITGKYKSKGVNETIKKKVIEVWRKGLEGTEILPIDMFRPLWLLSKYGCHYRQDGKRPKLKECPVKNYCVSGKVIVTSNRVEIET